MEVFLYNSCKLISIADICSECCEIFLEQLLSSTKTINSYLYRSISTLGPLISVPNTYFFFKKYSRVMIYFANFNSNINAYVWLFCYYMQKYRTQYCKFEYMGYFNGLQVTLFFLFYRIFQLLLANILKISRTEVKSQSSVPVDTGRKLNVHTTFRRRPERLLNVLCTFNLRPVSTGLVSVF